MAKVTKTALVPYSASKMYGLVNDVASYPKFLPWCRASQVLSETDTEMCARIELARSGIHQWFSTCNTLVKGERIDIHLIEGPFKRLHGDWQFLALREDACKIVLDLEYELAGSLINVAFGAVFGKIANTLVDAFVKRADEVYGRS